METQICSTCGIEKPITAFRLTGKGYLRHKCRTCYGKDINKWKREHPDNMKVIRHKNNRLMSEELKYKQNLRDIEALERIKSKF